MGATPIDPVPGASVIPPAGPIRKYDAFASYRSDDLSLVQPIINALGQMGLRIWFDRGGSVRPGDPAVPALEDAIKGTDVFLLFVGEGDQGPWQREEAQLAVRLRVAETRDKPADPVRRRNIPVILPGATPAAAESSLAGNSSWVQFQQGTTDQQALNWLYYGITGRSFAPPQPSPRSAQPIPEDPVGAAIDYLLDRLERNSIIFCVGAGASLGQDQQPLRTCEIARQLLLDLDLSDASSARLLPPVDIAAAYFALHDSDEGLEDTFQRLTQAHDVRPPAYEQLARVLQKLIEKRRERGTSAKKQLIVTTNLDTVLERTLLRAGIGFTRVVQHTSSPQLYVNRYHELFQKGANGQVLSFQNTDAAHLDHLIRDTGRLLGREGKPLKSEDVSSNDLVEPILYKFRGSLDIPNSSAISKLQIFDFARLMIANPTYVPAQITEIVVETPIVFLGAGYLDPDFSLLYYTLLNSVWGQKTRKYLVQSAPEDETEDCYRLMERGRIWTRLKEIGLKGEIHTVETRSEMFLARFYDRL